MLPKGQYTEQMILQTVSEIEKRVGYVFKDKQLPIQAFTHSSFANVENVEDNERMEFFGDAILEYLSSEYLYSNFRQCSEGELSAMRAKLVSAETLCVAVERLDLTMFLQTLNSELSHKTVANIYEAVLCAIYIDGGMAKARKFFLYSLKSELANCAAALTKDAKTRLQEYCQKNKLSLSYKYVGRDGPDNKPIFRYELYVGDRKQAEGKGPSKKAAEQDAANKLVTKWRID